MTAPLQEKTLAAQQADGSLAGTWTLDPARSTVALDTKTPRRDKHLRSKDFFLADENPSITFAVAKLTPAADGVTVEGTLTVRGRTNPVNLTASPAPVAHAAVALDATVEVDRSHYGLTWSQLGMASMHNTITLHAVFTRD